jgi:hypothetical protein
MSRDAMGRCGARCRSWGLPGDGDGDLTFPTGMVVDGDDVYVGDIAGAIPEFAGRPGLQKFRVELTP